MEKLGHSNLHDTHFVVNSSFPRYAFGRRIHSIFLVRPVTFECQCTTRTHTADLDRNERNLVPIIQSMLRFALNSSRARRTTTPKRRNKTMRIINLHIKCTKRVNFKMKIHLIVSYIYVIVFKRPALFRFHLHLLVPDECCVLRAFDVCL